ncbi:MAG TPA: hypothetical protein DCP31_31690, partial [Cyanobacteria bacterium UBA8543]|nr:hypothetical protein [Cyanobacteria bacterium UBA8543]
DLKTQLSRATRFGHNISQKHAEKRKVAIQREKQEVKQQKEEQQSREEGSGVLQMQYKEEKIGNNSTMTQALRNHRKHEDMWKYSGCQKNFAIDQDSPNTYGYSDAGGHSERNMLGNKLIEGHSAGDPINIHTEREPCLSCNNYLNGMHDKKVGTPKAFDMTVTYYVDYPGPGDSQQRLHEFYKQYSDIPEKRE